MKVGDNLTASEFKKLNEEGYHVVATDDDVMRVCDNLAKDIEHLEKRVSFLTHIRHQLTLKHSKTLT